MNEFLVMLIVFMFGIALGSVFFGGLWFTVKKALVSKFPALWFLMSFVLRIGTVMFGFYMVMQDANLLNGLFCLVGFIAARFIVIRLTKAYDAKKAGLPVKGVTHEA